MILPSLAGSIQLPTSSAKRCGQNPSQPFHAGDAVYTGGVPGDFELIEGLFGARGCGVAGGCFDGGHSEGHDALFPSSSESASWTAVSASRAWTRWPGFEPPRMGPLSSFRGARP